MSIYNFFEDLELTNDQHKAIELLNNFIVNDEHIFLLKGYAGTGKTTLLAGFIKYLDSIGKDYEVMAPTGRASKILRNKTGYGKTIHRSIYKLESVNVIHNKDEEINTLIEIKYPIKSLEKEGSILIIDESSMISSRESKQALFKFGTDNLLKDLLTYAQIFNKKTKIIFVGDPAQLLPVGDNKSWALDAKLFVSKDLNVNEIELKEVKRQDKNLILENSNIIRQVIDNEKVTELIFNYDNYSFKKIGQNEIIENFIIENPIPELNSSVIIAYSNNACYEYNYLIRERYFPNNKTISEGDIVQIVSNVYSGETEIYNGDFAKILTISQNTESISAPVYIEINGKRIKKIVTVNFRDVVIKLDNYSDAISVKIVDDLLHSRNRDLTYEEITAIYLNFVIKFNEQQNILKENGLDYYKVGSKIFKDQLLADPYVNAVRCKFGYSITCHKAQGGEWEKIFIDYTGRISLKQEPLRWCYTATTRGVSKVFAINPPHFSRFKKFEIGNITKISKIPKEAIIFEDIILSPFHSESQHLCKSKKYWDILSLLEGTNYSIKNVFSNDYLERYTIENDGELLTIEGYHNGNGFFEKPFKLTSGNDQKLVDIFNQLPILNYKINYQPSTEIFEKLFSRIQSICLEYDIYISNIIENLDNNYLNYYFITDSTCSIIQFYFNKDGHLTKALPKSFDVIDDKKFTNLLNSLKELSNE